MKINQHSKIRMAKRTRLGRVFCRLAGDQTGAVMMEYVILGVMIAAAATLAAIFFGKTIVQSFTTMTQATAGQTTSAAKTAKSTVSTAKTAKSASEANRKSITGGSGNAANQ